MPTNRMARIRFTSTEIDDDRDERKSCEVASNLRYGTLRPGWPSQRGQELAVQRPHRWRRARRAVPLRHQGSQHRRRQGSRRACRPPRGDEQVEVDRARRGAGRRHRRTRRGRVKGRGPGQQVPRQHPRGRCDRVGAARVRRRRRHRAERPDRTPPRRRDRVGPRRPGDDREAASTRPPVSRSSTRQRPASWSRCRPRTTRCRRVGRCTAPV